MRNILLYILLILPALSISAQQEQRNLLLSANDTVVERLILPPGESGMEIPLILKFCFNETANTVTVIAESTGNIFGLQSGARYRNIFRRGNINHKGGRFLAEKLPYDVQIDPGNTYSMGRMTRNSIGTVKERNNYYFHRWIESDDMDARSAKTPILGHQLLQVFSLANGQEKAKVSLRDIFTIEHKGANPSSWKKLQFTLHHDFNTTYNLQILHNPCFGIEEEIAKAKAKVLQLKERINKLIVEFPANAPLRPAVYETFMNHRDSLISIFPLNNQQSDCPDLQEVNDEYNKLVNMVLKQRRELSVPIASSSGEIVGNILGAKHLDANALQFKSRQLDELVGQWMLNTDKNERQNIRLQCQKIISDAAKLADGRVIDTNEQRHAVKTFQKALEYYRKTVGAY